MKMQMDRLRHGKLKAARWEGGMRDKKAGARLQAFSLRMSELKQNLKESLGRRGCLADAAEAWTWTEVLSGSEVWLGYRTQQRSVCLSGRGRGADGEVRGLEGGGRVGRGESWHDTCSSLGAGQGGGYCGQHVGFITWLPLLELGAVWGKQPPVVESQLLEMGNGENDWKHLIEIWSGLNVGAQHIPDIE